PPRPQRKIIAVALPSFLKAIRSVPVVALPKLLLVAHVATSEEEAAKLLQVSTLKRERLCNVALHRRVRGKPSEALLAGSKDGMTSEVICMRDDLCDHQYPRRSNAQAERPASSRPARACC